MRFLPRVNYHRAKILRALHQASSPHFFLDQAVVLHRLHQLAAELQARWGAHAIAYSYKTNPLVAQQSFFRQANPWIEVVSESEYQRVLELGYHPSTIVVNGPYKPLSFLRLISKNGSLLHLHHPAELQAFFTLPKTLQKKVAVGIRLNLDLPELPSRFGFSVAIGDAVQALTQLAAHGLHVSSLHVHLGSDVYARSVYSAAGKRLRQFLLQHREYFQELQYLDCGGGFHSHALPPHHSTHWDGGELEEFLHSLLTPLAKTAGVPKPTLILEPGRFLVDDAIFFVSTVINCQRNSNEQSVTIDSTITMLPSTWYRPHIIRAFSPILRPKTGRRLRTTIFGCSCQETDVLFTGELPQLKLGDRLIFFCVGAYNQAMAADFIFPRPPMTAL